MALKFPSLFVSLAAPLTAISALTAPALALLLGRTYSYFSVFTNEISENPVISVKKCAIGIVCVGLIDAITSWIMLSLWCLDAKNNVQSIWCKLMSSIVVKPISWFETEADISGKMTICSSYINEIYLADSRSRGALIRYMVVFLSAFTLSLYKSWSLALVSVAGIPLLILVVSWLANLSVSWLDSYKSSGEKALSISVWTLSSLPTVKLYCMEHFQQRLFSSYIKDARSSYLKVAKYIRLQRSFTKLIANFMFLQAFYYGAVLSKAGKIAAADVLIVFWCSFLIAEALGNISQQIGSLQKGRLAKTNIAKFFDSETRKEVGQVLSDDEIHRAAIEFKHVSFNYPTRPGNDVFKDLNIKIPGGVISFIIGKSGSGKSSIASLIMSRYPISSGEILLNALPISSYNQNWLRKHVLVVEQESYLFDVSVDNNVSLGMEDKVPQSKIDDAYKDCIVNFDTGIAVGINGGANLSGGEKQRAGLARAWVHDSPIMIFDEPVSALDPPSRHRLLQNLRKKRSGKTTVIILHDMSLLNDKDHVTIVEEGKALTSGTFEKVKVSDEFRRLACNSQTTIKVDNTRAEIEAVFKSNHTSYGEDTDTCDSQSFSSCRSTVNKRRSMMEVVDDCQVGTTDSVKLKPQKVTSYKVLKNVRHRGLLILGLLLSIVNNLTNPVLAFLVSKLLALIVNPGGNLSVWGGAIVALAFFDAGTLYLSQTILDYVAECWLAETRMRSFNRLINSSNQRISKSVSTMYVNNSEDVRILISTYIPNLISTGVLLFVASIWAFIEGWLLSLVATSIIISSIAILYGYKLLDSIFELFVISSKSILSSKFAELSSSIKTIQSLSLEKYWSKEFTNLIDSQNTFNSIHCVWEGFGFGLTRLFAYVGQAISLYLGIKFIYEGSYTVQQTMLVFTLMSFALTASSHNIITLPQVESGFATAQELKLIQNLSSVESSAGLNRLIKGSVIFDRVTFKRGRHNVLSDFKLEIEAFETVSIMGPSGSGKSTLISLLTKLEFPETGSVKVDGMDVCKMSPHCLRSQICIVSQMPIDFFEGSIWSNVQFGNDKIGVRAIFDALQEVGLEQVVAELPEGYHTRIGDASKTLSGGQLQRLAIARALVRNPAILILDEVTSGLDPGSLQIVKQLVDRRKQQRNMTIIIITHQQEMADVGDRIVNMEDLQGRSERAT